MIRYDIDIEAGDWSDLAGDRAIRRALDAVEAAGSLPSGLAGPATPSATPFDLSILLTDDGRMRELNHRWRGVDRPTNVLSFPAEDRTPDAPPRLAMLGDVVVAHETLHREAREGGIRPVDHFTHLIIHGVLHLFGHDHLNDADAERMEAIETQALATLGIADPYAQ